MKKILILFLSGLFMIPLHSQILLLNEDFGANGSFASAEANPPSSYDLDPAASYLETEGLVINYYGNDIMSTGKYTGASGDNFFLLSNNWALSDVVMTWANMDVEEYSELSEIKFGCAFAGGANAAWTGNWLFSLQYSFDDVLNDPGNATWNNIDLISSATGWPDPEVAGADLWSLVSVDAGINLNGIDLLSVRIVSNGNFDYHFDDFQLYVKTPSSGMERSVIAKETFGPNGFYRGPANEYTGYSNGGSMVFNDYQVRYQNFASFTNNYDGNSNDGDWWISQQENEGVREDTLVFSLNTLLYADVQLEFGFTYWGGVPGNMVGIYYTTDSVEWYPLVNVNPEYSYPGTNEETINDGYFHLIKYSDLLPRAEKLTLKIFQATTAQLILDDIALTGVYSTLSDDASLSGISFPENSELSLEPSFDSEITSYTVLLPPGTTDAPLIDAATTDETAEFIVEDALDVRSGDEADRQSYIYVTAGDGETNMLYTITFNVDNTGVQTDTDLGISIYPNPVRDQLKLKCDKAVEIIQIYSLSGSHIQSFETGNSYQADIDVGFLNSGMYFLKIINTEGESELRKIVKE